MTNRLEQATKLSELLLIAIEDFQKRCEVENFNPCMGDWIEFRPIIDPETGEKLDEEEYCFGCLAGATLMEEDCTYSKYLCEEFDGTRHLDFDKLPEDIGDKMRAINYLRTGSISEACLAMFGEENWKMYEDFGVKKFWTRDDDDTRPDNRIAFIESLSRLYDHLLELGL